MKVLSINIEYGGYYLYEKTKSFSFIDKYVELIKIHDIDVVCFQEAIFLGKKEFDITKIIADKLGYYHKSNKYSYLSIISKFPLKKISNNKYNFITCLCNDLLITNLHLNDEPNTYYSLINRPYNNTPMNINEKQAIDLSYESKEKDIKNMLSLIKNKNGIICGDFNELSHLDSIEWKTSKKIYKKGFKDVVRYFYPDSKKYPLYTCDIQRKETKGNPPMRIDMIYFKGLKPKCVKYLYKLKLKWYYLSDHIPILTTFDLKQ